MSMHDQVKMSHPASNAQQLGWASTPGLIENTFEQKGEQRWNQP